MVVRRFTAGIAGRSMVLLALLLGGARPAAAQEDEPLWRQLEQTFKKDYLSIGVLLQTVADFQVERSAIGSNGFNISNFRLSLSGNLDHGFSYFLQTNFAATPTILDARLTYRASPNVALDVGQFKAPFSYEFLTSAASIDFVNRSQTVTVLAPGRQLGLQARVGRAGGPAAVSAGVFNGNGFAPNANDGNHLMYVARVTLTPRLGAEGAPGAAGGLRARQLPGSPRGLTVGLHAALSEDEGTALGGGLAAAFTGRRTLFGADVRYTENRLLLAGEVVASELDPDIGVELNPWGFHATAGYMFAPKVQGLLRWERFEPDNGTPRREFLILGLNVWPTTVTEFQVNYLVDTDNTAADNHQLLINFQIGF